MWDLLTSAVPAGLVTASLLAVAAQAAGAPQPQARASEAGLAAVFFHDIALQRPASADVDEQINMKLTDYNDCSKLWLGQITFPAGGEMSLSGEAAQGLRLFLGGECVIDGWSPTGARSGKVQVTAGQTLPLRLEYYHLGGEAYLRLYWEWEGHRRELIPAQAFTHSEADRRHAEAVAAGREWVGPGNQGPLPRPQTAVHSAPAGDEAFRALIYTATAVRRELPAVPYRLCPGPHLFVDDELIEASDNLIRRVNRPRRDPAIPNPIITGPEDHCYQPYLTVLRDPSTGRFRIWYGAWGDKTGGVVSHVGYAESDDGIHFERPARMLEDPGPIQFGCSVVDDGPEAADPARRYKLAWWHDGGLKLATSPDGLRWSMLVPWPVLRHNHDINNLFWDALRNRYMATISVYTTGPTWSGRRRVTMQSISRDLLTWEKPWYVLTPVDGVDPGMTQFYAMCGYIIRGDLLIGLVKVLRDELRASGTPEGAYGVGYTTLAWSRDGRTWVRDPEPFFEPDPEPTAWDHAHAWMDCQLPVGDQVYIYYGGYKSGHKMNATSERQIGLVRMARDRYVSRGAGVEEGLLRTVLVTFQASGMTVNANVRGDLRVRILDEAGAPLPGFDFKDCAPLRGDSLEHAVTWRGDLASLGGKPVRLEFRLREAQLYGFELATPHDRGL